MTKILALDLSKRRTGWALWHKGWESPRYGHWILGSEFTTDGEVLMKALQCLTDHWQALQFSSLYWEEPLTQMQRMGQSNKGNDIQVKLVGICQYFAKASRTRTQEINQTSWRRSFIGKMPRGTKSKEWKDYAMERSRHFGWAPRFHDEADALGLLDHCISLEGVTPPWRENQTLIPMLSGAR